LSKAGAPSSEFFILSSIHYTRHYSLPPSLKLHWMCIIKLPFEITSNVVALIQDTVLFDYITDEIYSVRRQETPLIVETPGNNLSSSHCRHPLPCFLLKPVSAHPTDCPVCSPYRLRVDHRDSDGTRSVSRGATSHPNSNLLFMRKHTRESPITLVIR
jgi:hypothetical protein